MSARLPTTVTHLEVHGENTVATSSVCNLIGTFYRVDTISIYEDAIGTILRGVCWTRDMPEGEKSGEEESPASGIQALHIHDCLGDREDLYPALHQIYNNAKPIRVFFENCPNNLPTVRKEFMHVRANDNL